MKKKSLFIAIFISMFFVALGNNSIKTQAAEKTASQKYVDRMGSGWNLGNSFDGFDTGGDLGEESWGNPIVTRELIQAVKAKGFDSIRLPFTTEMRIDENNVIDSEFLDRYEKVVNYALEEDLLIMVNVHHDSWSWLANWNGDTEAEEFKKFNNIWEQLAERFKDYDDRVMFESINEPQFYGVDDAVAIERLTALNQSFYNIIRNSDGNNADRMLVLPTLLTDNAQNRLDALQQHILSLEDPNLIATIHYYSEWVYSANVGITRFDEILWDEVTSRTSMISVFDRVHETFTQNGIGVVIGEYGLLGYDKGDDVNQLGETLKYIEMLNHYAQEKGFNTMLWDNGQHLNRYTYEWNNPLFGEMIEVSMHTRSAYATGLNTTFLGNKTEDEQVGIELTLNGQELVAIYLEERELVRGTDYFYEDGSIILSQSFLDEITQQYEENYTGVVAALQLSFTNGADWHQYLVKSETPVMSEASGEKTTGLSIPTEFNGNQLEKVVSKDQDGAIASHNDWWDYLENGFEFYQNPAEGSIFLTSSYLNVLSDGVYSLHFTFYNGETVEYRLLVDGDSVSGIQLTEGEDLEQPVNPEEPINPEEPTVPIEPVQPVEPEDSVDPEEPVEIVKPEVPVEIEPDKIDNVIEIEPSKTKEQVSEKEKQETLPNAGSKTIWISYLGLGFLIAGIGVFSLNFFKKL
ncbi:cellulase family glycosylhydrolase [Jeotgalibaca ciconiae]|uniref:Cellulase n=1 Tax=Jeotgalibaca ciconiae TaxID=2496265 RepID=A0A3Q9BKH3_9LACT|nr:cellulase family glycosylhydrolase [Jeotgalibaca ciconiae]AZP04533.1 cellulase [Jeotgalibaca ciconiae]HJB23082.1 cellulase family glycosylhydrolase [Candidatus Jeotgalibaca pullicola]